MENNLGYSISCATSLVNPNSNELMFQLHRAMIEVQNGLNARLLIIETQLDIENLYDQVTQTLLHLKITKFHGTLCSFCSIVQGRVFVSILSTKPAQQSAAPFHEINFDLYQKGSVLEKAKILYSLSCAPRSKELKEQLKPFLLEESSQGIRVLATLAAELLTCWDSPVSPKQFVQARSEAFTAPHTRKITESELFEDKIDVNAYNYFELLHPSYARQSVALVNQVLQYASTNKSKICVDVGTGPGTALLMQKELMGDYQFIAIEPSAVAFKHLVSNIEGDSSIVPLEIDFLQYAPNERYEMILSTGASHHLNTLAFFQKCHELLKPEGTLVISDEMLSYYSSVDERKKTLITHHTSYIIELLESLESIDSLHGTPTENTLRVQLHRFIPLASALAALGEIIQAEKIVRTLLLDLRRLDLGITISTPLLAFYRLIYLELEAMVAGLDYEVEQKTYPRKLRQLAERAGFQCVYHECIHSTSDQGLDGSGTHLFTFRK